MSLPRDWISVSGSASTRLPRTSAGCVLNCGPFHSPFEIFFAILQSLRSSSRSWIHHWSVWNSRCISSFSSPCRLGSSQRLNPVVLLTRRHLRREHPASGNASPQRRRRRRWKQSWLDWSTWNNGMLSMISWDEKSKAFAASLHEVEDQLDKQGIKVRRLNQICRNSERLLRQNGLLAEGEDMSKTSSSEME